MKALYGEKEMLLASNKSLAEYNLSQVPSPDQSSDRLGHFPPGARVEGEQGQLGGEVRHGRQARRGGEDSPDSA